MLNSMDRPGQYSKEEIRTLYAIAVRESLCIEAMHREVGEWNLLEGVAAENRKVEKDAGNRQHPFCQDTVTVRAFLDHATRCPSGVTGASSCSTFPALLRELPY